MRDRVSVDSRAFAQTSRAFVISACGTIDDAAIATMELSAQDESLIRDPDFCGGSLIAAPDSRIIAGPLGNEEAILYADLDLDIGGRMQLRHDFAGHYNRHAERLGRTARDWAGRPGGTGGDRADPPASDRDRRGGDI